MRNPKPEEYEPEKSRFELEEIDVSGIEPIRPRAQVGRAEQSSNSEMAQKIDVLSPIKKLPKPTAAKPSVSTIEQPSVFISAKPSDRKTVGISKSRKKKRGSFELYVDQLKVIRREASRREEISDKFVSKSVVAREIVEAGIKALNLDVDNR
jgi:hypothetical protein